MDKKILYFLQLLKPQVERRRRERMNRSLDNLRLLLLQGPEHTNPVQKRPEKAEILEYTVRFLQNSVTHSKKTMDLKEREKSQFMDGFSSCLQRAACFLEDEGEARGLEGNVSSTLCQRLSRPCVSTTLRLPARVRSSFRMQFSGSKTQHHMQAEKQTPAFKQVLLAPCRKSAPQSRRAAFRSTDSNTLHSTEQATSHHQAPVCQPVWRPWP
ncbi:hypothetical protein DNTS_034631 [Danionella cerebrum]|uniref:BHLH domain-containing protein n=1 Tax=Danionella cerebrum TaxID=2873325 RepID=A0A553QH67_9TELE|nr:hypothetical protein DNTS_034522 [Danionella translucida]TRY89257.1 hypothetical protein DNTS_034631 [Danionella translucida]